jgi:hypothetical protein
MRECRRTTTESPAASGTRGPQSFRIFDLISSLDHPHYPHWEQSLLSSPKNQNREQIERPQRNENQLLLEHSKVKDGVELSKYSVFFYHYYLFYFRSLLRLSLAFLDIHFVSTTPALWKFWLAVGFIRFIKDRSQPRPTVEQDFIDLKVHRVLLERPRDHCIHVWHVPKGQS